MELALDFKSHSNLALPAKPGHCHLPQVLALWEWVRVLREAADLLQPLHAGNTLLEGGFWRICTSLVPLGFFRGMGRTEQPLFVCRLDMLQQIQRLQQRCLELWTRQPRTLGAGRRDYFLPRYLPRRPGGEAVARPYTIVHMQRPWALGAGRPHQPQAAESQPLPCRRCPID